MIATDAFAETVPSEAAAQFGDDAIHLWRLPYRRSEGRTPLLALLAEYCGVDASSAILREDEHGKPRLITSIDGGEEQPATGRLQFNWSHSGNHALVALARGVAPGVDIERIRPRIRALDLARRFFAHEEFEILAACDEEERNAAFLQLWCAKEAALKAIGRGIAFGLERAVFTCTHDGWKPAYFPDEVGGAQAWQIRRIAPADGYAGALAWRGPARSIRRWRPRNP